MQVLYSPPLTGRKLLQAPAVDLTNATTLASIMTIAAQLVPTQADSATTAALIQGLTPDQLAAVGTAVANLNADVASASDASTIEKGQYYAQTEVLHLAVLAQNAPAVPGRAVFQFASEVAQMIR